MRVVIVMAVVLIVMATAIRLLVARIDVSATGTDPTFQNRATFFTVVVLSEYFTMVVQSVVIPTRVVGVGTFTGLTRLATVIIGEWGVRSHIESNITSTA